MAFRCVLIILNGLWRSETFFDIYLNALRFSEVFSWVLSSSEKHLDAQKCHLTLWGNLRRFCRF